MIHWLVQATDAHPDLTRGIPPPGLLGFEERAKFDGLKTDKRRRDWLLGRWTAKHLLQELIQQKIGERPPLDTLVIRANKVGAPITDYGLRITGHGLSLSISHSHGHAFCAVVERPSHPLGADMERIEPRRASFAVDYFTEAEMALVRRVSGAMREGVVTAVWSAKEAALKALQLGLAVDTRAVTCLIEPAPEPPQSWTPFAIQLDEKRLGRPAPALTGWYRTMGDFVLTLAAQDEKVVD
ncbi:MAG: 4'-phosphopantetheinyl transferase superfamily protein [Chloroflexi bacterium]|nr:4'-phosphopantetheinyl transferase superfamily protein [Chloroflexota bacterium]